jgi:hypothetical protein
MIMVCIFAVHGAGLGHMLYMKPNSIVVEIAPSENDGRLHLGKYLGARSTHIVLCWSVMLKLYLL